MLIDQDNCNGCGICVPYCPVGAIALTGEKASIDLDLCAECGTCGRHRVVKCPTHAIQEQPDLYDGPRAVAKYFSDPTTTHKVTKVPGRGTEEVKTNDVTGRVRRGELGIAVEMGRPVLGTSLAQVEKVTTRLAPLGVRFEEKNPLTDLISRSTGAFPEEIREVRMISVIIEFTVPAERLEAVVDALKDVAEQLDTVFSLGLISRFEPDGSLPVLPRLRSMGLAARPNAKINLGLGRPLAGD
ncbi:MAG: DUF362 domain-containing protein [Bacillota bacterium]